MRQLPHLFIRPLFIASFVLVSLLEAQERPTLPDTLATAPTDTTRKVSGVDTVVVYNAKDSITYSLQTRYMNLFGKGEISYRTIDLKAERVFA